MKRGSTTLSPGQFKRRTIRRTVTAALALLVFAPLVGNPRALMAQMPPPLGGAGGGATSDEEVEELAKTEGAEIHVKNAEIASIVRIFSKKTKRNYILDEAVKGKVTIFLPGKVSADEALRILDSVLALKGFASVPIGENLWKIVPARLAKQSTIPTRIDASVENPSAAMVTKLVSLKYIAADEARQIVTPLISADGLVNAYAGTNSLILIDSEDNIERLLVLVNAIDVPFTDREMTIIPVKFADAADIATKLNDILGNPSAGGDKGGDSSAMNSLDLIRSRLQQSVAGQPGGGLGAPGSSTAGGGVQPMATSLSGGRATTARSREPKIIPDERTNSIIVVADEDTTARVRALINQLDSEMDLSGNRYYVYRCQHAKAEELAEVLSGLGGNGSGRSSTGSTSNTLGGSLGQPTDAIRGGTAGSGSRKSSSSSGRSSGSGLSRAGQGRSLGQSGLDNKRGTTGSVSLGENISITADPTTNSLIISAGKNDYLKIKELLQGLDVRRRQVLVEAMLLEVAIDDSHALGTEFSSSIGGADGGILGRNQAAGLPALLANPSGIQNFSLAAASAGTITLPGGTAIPSQAVLLTAVQANTNVNVLSAPNILTTDNEEAQIVVGQNVPFLASTSSSSENLGNTFNQIDRQDVGITLRITPQISSGDSITLKLFTEVSDVVAATASSPLGPTTTVRTSETTVITKDSQMVVIGGLMSDNLSDSATGVPFLKDIPVLGHLFRTASTSNRRTNLLIFITPRIVQDQYDARDVTIDQRNILQHEITSHEINPDRSEVLHSLSIDRVSEGKEYTGQAPGTIVGKAASKTEPLVQPESESVTGAAGLAGAASLAGTASASSTASAPVPAQAPAAPAGDAPPPVPSAESALQPAATPTTAAPARLKISPKLPATLLGSRAGSYVVLRLKGNLSEEQKQKLPFSLSRDQGLVGIFLSPEGGLPLFQTGSTYRYQVTDTEVPLTVLGVYSSPVEVAEHGISLTSPWYELSPHEAMNFGKGPWVSAEAAPNSKLVEPTVSRHEL